MPNNWAGTHEKVDDALNAKGVALSFGHVVVGAIHDYDNVAGVKATVGNEEVTLYGDKNLGRGDEERLAVAAVQASVAEIDEAYRLGSAGVPAGEIPGTLKAGLGPVYATDGLFAAERMLPKAVPDDGTGGGSLDPARGLVESGPSVPWQFGSYQELLADASFAVALNIFGVNKAGELADVVKDQPEKAQRVLEERVTSRLRGGQAVEVVREVIEWLPELEGEESVTTTAERLDYVDQAIATQGGVEGLALPQRLTLVNLLLDWPDPGPDKAFKLLVANPDQTEAVIDEIGYETVADKIGMERFQLVLIAADKGKDALPVSP